MKFRTIAVILILIVAAGLPAVAQQGAAPQPAGQHAQAATPPTDSGKAAEKSACPCCEHMNHQGQANSPAHPSMGCCHGKDAKAGQSMSCCEGKDMPCCKKDGQDKQASSTCCHGKDGKMCAKQNGKHCCDGSDGNGCCGKNNTASSIKDAKGCC